MKNIPQERPKVLCRGEVTSPSGCKLFKPSKADPEQCHYATETKRGNYLCVHPEHILSCGMKKAGSKGQGSRVEGKQLKLNAES
jgi:hypothetical protein